MLEHMKKPHTENVKATFIGSYEALKKLRSYAEKLGLEEVEESLPWKKVLNSSQGTILKGARLKEGMTQKILASKTGIPQGHISAMENDKMTIGKERAKRLAKVLNVDYRIFL